MCFSVRLDGGNIVDCYAVSFCLRVCKPWAPSAEEVLQQFNGLTTLRLTTTTPVLLKVPPQPFLKKCSVDRGLLTASMLPLSKALFLSLLQGGLLAKTAAMAAVTVKKRWFTMTKS